MGPSLKDRFWPKPAARKAQCTAVLRLRQARDLLEILKAIKHSHKASDGTYRLPCAVRDLVGAGFSWSDNRVTRLMKAVGIKSRHKRRFAPGQLNTPVHAIAPSLLEWQWQTGRHHEV
jgi:hypothetical protein